MVGVTLQPDDYKKVFVDNTNLLTEDAFKHVVATARKTSRPLEQLLMERAFIAPHQLLQLLADYTQAPATELRVSDINRESLGFMPERQAEEFLAVPFDHDDTKLKVAMANPKNDTLIREISQYSSRQVEPYIATEHAIRRALVLYDGDIADILKNIIAKGQGPQAASTVATDLVTAILETSILLDASDVHIEPFEDGILLRMRVDGLLRQVTTLPLPLLQAMVTHLKIRASLRVDERRLPQDGRFSVDIKGQEINVRLSTVPSLWGEKIVLRILPKEAHLFDINNVGFLESDLTLIRKYLKRPYGMILVCGPTGSGKTTTLYSFIQEISNDRIDIVNISTIEDPIEYTIPRVTQIQTKPEIELTFAAGLRALLRQDPDIIMVGEIRDKETADFGVRASLVGRLVLSSLHTNDAVGAVPRLLDMGVEPYLVSSTVALVVAQRLARKLCLYCRQSYTPDAVVLKQLSESHDVDQALKVLRTAGVISASTKLSGLRFFKPVGCARCNNTGYSGRTAVYEILEMSDGVRNGLAEHKDASELKKIALTDGMKTMFADGLGKMILGHIDLDELIRVVY